MPPLDVLIVVDGSRPPGAKSKTEPVKHFVEALISKLAIGPENTQVGDFKIKKYSHDHMFFILIFYTYYTDGFFHKVSLRISLTVSMPTTKTS